MFLRNFTLMLTLVLLTAACTTSNLYISDPQERKQAILDMRDEVLTELYSLKPDTRVQISDASGYAVFTNANINLFLASVSGGFGVVHDNERSEDTYMRRGEVGVGLGAGVKDFRAVLVFHDRETLDRFLDVGVAVGGEADAAAKASDFGVAVGGEAMIDNVTVYQLTQAGLALQATIKGTLYWRDHELN